MANITFDIDSIKQRILSNLIGKENWKNILYYSTSIPLAEAFAEEIHDLAIFNMYLTNENTWKLAKNYSSLLAMQDMIPYVPQRKISAKGYIKISASKTFDSSYGKDIIIPASAVFQTENNINFVIDSEENQVEYILSGSDNYILLPIIQGIKKENNLTITNTIDFQFIIILEDNIEQNSLFLYVNDEEWIPVDSIYESKELEKVYQVYRDPNILGLKLLTGNNKTGKRLSSGDSITYKYVVSDGVYGNVLTINAITKINQTGEDTDGDLVTLYCTNESIVTGGVDEENMESIRANAPQQYQTGDRCQNNDDYKYILTHDSRTSFVKKCVVWGYEDILLEGDTLFNVGTNENVVHIAMLGEDFEEVDTEYYKENLKEVLLEKKGPTDIIKMEHSEIMSIGFISNIVLTNKSYLIDNIKNAVKLVLKNKYGLSAIDYFNHIYYSDYNDAITEVLKDSNSNMIGHHITDYNIIKKGVLTKSAALKYVATIEINVLSIKSGSFYITSSDLEEETGETLIAQDADPSHKLESNGTIYGVGHFSNYVQGFINYNTGEGYFNIIGDPLILKNSYVLRFYWKNISKDNTIVSDITLTKRNQIIGYSELDTIINVSYSK